LVGVISFGVSYHHAIATTTNDEYMDHDLSDEMWPHVPTFHDKQLTDIDTCVIVIVVSKLS
jgi:hypothetical protein